LNRRVFDIIFFPCSMGGFWLHHSIASSYPPLCSPNSDRHRLTHSLQNLPLTEAINLLAMAFSSSRQDVTLLPFPVVYIIFLKALSPRSNTSPFRVVYLFLFNGLYRSQFPSLSLFNNILFSPTLHSPSA
jgi:hypothetical protein